MPLFGPPNVEQLKAKRDMNGLIKALRYNDPSIRRCAVAALADLRDARAVQALASVLHDQAQPVRQLAIQALQQFGNENATDALIGVLETGEQADRQAALVSLCKIGIPAVDRLGYMLGHPFHAANKGAYARALEQVAASSVDPVVRTAVVRCLLRKQSGAQLPEHIAGWTDDSELLIEISRVGPTAAKKVASQKLDQIGCKGDRPEQVAAYLVAVGRWNQCVALGGAAVDPLVEALQRGLAGAAAPLAELVVAQPDADLSARIVKVLIERLAGPDASIRQAAENALTVAAPAGGKAAQQLIESLRSPDPEARAAAARVLGQLRDPGAVEPLIACYENERWGSVSVKTAIAEALGRIGDSRAVPTLISLTAQVPALSGEYWLVCVAVRALGSIGDPRAIEPLCALLRDPTANDDATLGLRHTAAEVLIQLYQTSKLDERAKSIILSHKELITRPHSDEMRPGYCGNYHFDEGIGLEFPL